MRLKLNRSSIGGDKDEYGVSYSVLLSVREFNCSKMNGEEAPKRLSFGADTTIYLTLSTQATRMELV